ncbi:MAG TPA: hypothetical protein DDX39_06050 [Bacteroidales bacterium]|nr:MAG: hypothetical protein A2W98_07315 [Bacteroidetes bacterium GWF2_33_38]OFY89949.1 MAG: hypothetical protein A2236_10775 [Bacteroidetes bacterium RIFOXYA2_FULL_33_7]HBF88188.1 hypothetical protein [Bacteroidales bacterium]
MIKFILLILLSVIYVCGFSQTVIEMTHPADANLVMLEVEKFEDADIVVFRTNDKVEAQEWDCKWKFRSWGFSDFSVYLTKNEKDSLLLDPETGITLEFDGKIHFTDDKTKVGYRNRDFRLEGVFRKIKLDEIE